MAEPIHLYVHWPWCQAKCPYCDFNSHALPVGGLSQSTREAYINQIIKELSWWQQQISPHRPLQSVFFGGGTPSLMQAQEIARILQAAQALGAWQGTTEVTVECNPTSLGEDRGLSYFKELKSVGVNRLSLGVQGLRDDWLSFLGRRHNAAGALASLTAAQTVFNRVNADVIYGLPGQNLADWEALLRQLGGMGLSHLAAYQLTVERNTAFWGQVRQGLWQPVDRDVEADFFDLTSQVLNELGYANYEISNFAKPGEACRHNLGVWRSEDYVGVGAGAHGRVTLANGTRVATATRKLPEAYVQADATDFARFVTWEPLNAIRGIQEALFAGLRLEEGVDVTQLQKTYGMSAWNDAVRMAEFQDFVAAGWLRALNDGHQTRWRLTTSGWGRLDGLLQRLLTPLPTPNAPERVRIHPANDCA